jgi:hypothetical protein
MKATWLVTIRMRQVYRGEREQRSGWTDFTIPIDEDPGVYYLRGQHRWREWRDNPLADSDPHGFEYGALLFAHRLPVDHGLSEAELEE